MFVEIPSRIQDELLVGSASSSETQAVDATQHYTFSLDFLLPFFTSQMAYRSYFL